LLVPLIIILRIRSPIRLGSGLALILVPVNRLVILLLSRNLLTGVVVTVDRIHHIDSLLISLWLFCEHLIGLNGSLLSLGIVAAVRLFGLVVQLHDLLVNILRVILVGLLHHLIIVVVVSVGVGVNVHVFGIGPLVMSIITEMDSMLLT